MSLTIAEIAESHYLPEKRQRRRANTVYGYECSLRLHVLPRWGALGVAEISRDDVQAWVDGLAGEAGPGGAEKAYKCLRQVVRWAIRKWSLYVADPTVGIEMPRKPAYRPDTLTKRRLKRLVRGFVGHEHESTVILGASLGLRPGEGYSVRWEQINWRTGCVPVRSTLQQVPGEMREYLPKTRQGERDCWLPAWALDRLHQIWVGLGRPKGRVIGDAKPSGVAAKVARHIRRERLPRITLKNLRHTWGTIAAQSGVSMETVAAMMGHSSIQTTYQHYFRLSSASAKRAQRRVARHVLGKTCDDMYRGIEIPPPQPAAMAA